MIKKGSGIHTALTVAELWRRGSLRDRVTSHFMGQPRHHLLLDILPPTPAGDFFLTGKNFEVLFNFNCFHLSMFLV